MIVGLNSLVFDISNEDILIYDLEKDISEDAVRLISEFFEKELKIKVIFYEIENEFVIFKISNNIEDPYQIINSLKNYISKKITSSRLN